MKAHPHPLDRHVATVGMMRKVDDPSSSSDILLDLSSNDSNIDDSLGGSDLFGKTTVNLETDEITCSRKSLTFLARKLRNDHRSLSVGQVSPPLFEKRSNTNANFDAQRLGYLLKSREVISRQTDRMRYSRWKRSDAVTELNNGCDGRIFEKSSHVEIDLSEVTTSSGLDYVECTSRSFESRQWVPLQKRSSFDQHELNSSLRRHHLKSDIPDISLNRITYASHTGPLTSTYSLKSNDNESISCSCNWEMIDIYPDIDEYSHHECRSISERDTPPAAVIADSLEGGNDYLLQLSSLMLGTTCAAETRTGRISQNNNTRLPKEGASAQLHTQPFVCDDDSASRTTGNRSAATGWYHCLTLYTLLLLCTSFMALSRLSHEHFLEFIDSSESILIRLRISTSQVRNSIAHFILASSENGATSLVDCIVHSLHKNKLKHIRMELRNLMEFPISQNIKHAYRKLIESNRCFHWMNIARDFQIPTTYIQNLSDFHPAELSSLNRSLTEAQRPEDPIPVQSPFHLDVILPSKSNDGFCDINQHMCSINEHDEYTHQYGSRILQHFWKRNGPFIQQINNIRNSNIQSNMNESHSVRGDDSFELSNQPIVMVSGGIDRDKLENRNKETYHADDLFDTPLMETAMELFHRWRISNRKSS